MTSTPYYAFEILCPHEADRDVSTYREVPDYHPLTSKEIGKLLDFAKEHKGDSAAVSKVQIRLVQGIPGMTCPRPVNNEVAERQAKLESIFVKRYKLGGTADLVEEIELIMKR